MRSQSGLFIALVMLPGLALGYLAAGNLALPWGVATAQYAMADDDNSDRKMLDRTVLPIAEPTLTPITEIDARKAKAPPFFQVKSPQGDFACKW